MSHGEDLTLRRVPAFHVWMRAPDHAIDDRSVRAFRRHFVDKRRIAIQGENNEWKPSTKENSPAIPDHYHRHIVLLSLLLVLLLLAMLCEEL